MVLDNVSQGDPHVSAHNAERAVINELDTNAVRKTLANAKGDLLVASANDVVTRLPVSASDGAILIVDAAAPNGVRWSTGVDNVLSEVNVNAVRRTLVDAKGDLIVGAADDAVARLPASATNGALLVTDSSTGTGLRWSTATDAQLTDLNTNAVRKTLVDAKGDLLVGTADDTIARVAGPTVNGSVLIADSAQTAGVRWSEGLYLRGDGFPEGAVTAPIGSRYIDKLATNGAVEWIKASGSGSTGWEIVYGDTGWRDISSLLVNGWTANQVRVRRNGENIFFWFLALVATSATADTILTLPDGFKPSFVQRFPIMDTTVTTRQLNVDSAGALRVLLYQTSDASLDACSAVWLAGTAATPGNWPAALPGSAV